MGSFFTTGGTTTSAAGGGGGQGVESLFGTSTIGGTGFRKGGSFRVPGTGATDSRVIGFRAAPGERVTVEPVGAGTMGKPTGGNVSVQVINNGAPVEADVQTQEAPDGSQFIQVILSAVAEDISSNGTVGRALDTTRGTRQRGIGR